MLSAATKWEVYPWVEERVKNNVYTAISTAMGVIVFAIVSIPLGSQHEMGSAPNGGTGTRFLSSIIVSVLALGGFLSITPWMDAKQASDKHVKAVNQFTEWKEILTNEDTAPVSCCC